MGGERTATLDEIIIIQHPSVIQNELFGIITG